MNVLNERLRILRTQIEAEKKKDNPNEYVLSRLTEEYLLLQNEGI